MLCRDNEIDLMIDILCRRRKNNPVVVGEAGVGKSALIEGLALRIVDGRVPDKLRDTDIMTLDLGALQAGASVKGEFEKRFKGLMAEVIQSPKPVILFIDEAHTLIGAGNQQGGLDISNLLKPALARGELKTIAATTWSEYKKYFEKDAALSRRFQLVKVSEPTAAEATIILRGLSAVYEQSHGVLIDDEALQAAATLSERYLSGRQLPDKAIDVLDGAACTAAVSPAVHYGTANDASQLGAIPAKCTGTEIHGRKIIKQGVTVFRLPTPRLFSNLRSALRPAMPRFKVSAAWLLTLAWIVLLVWIWWKGPSWSLYDEQWLKPLTNRWLATAGWALVALIWLTVRVMKRLQQLEKQQKQQREEEKDPLSVELNAQQRYLDRWLLRLQRHLDSRRYLWQLPWYMVIGPSGSGKTSLLREGFPSDIIYAPEAIRGVEQRRYVIPHVGKQAVIFDADGILFEQPEADILHRRLWTTMLDWLARTRARQPLNGLILTLDLPDLLTADKRRREHLTQILRGRLQDIRQHLHCQLPVYVVLTRLDLLHGFATLFQSLGRKERDAILGVTFTRHAHENDDWRTELNAF